jgi:outer membrane protein assembly factor BamB
MALLLPAISAAALALPPAEAEEPRQSLWETPLPTVHRRDCRYATAAGGIAFLTGVRDENTITYAKQPVIAALDLRHGTPLWDDVGPTGTRLAEVGAAATAGKSLVVAGSRRDLNDYRESFVRAYDQRSGTLLWSDTTPHSEHPAVAASGRTAYVAMTLEPESADERIAIRAHDLATGAVLWEESWPEEEDQAARAEALVVSAGIVAVLGHSVPAGAGAKHDALAVAFDARTGARIWDQTFEHAGEYETFKAGLARGRTLVAGGYATEGGRLDELLVAYDIRTGSELWSSVPSLPGDQYITALGLAGSRLIALGSVNDGGPGLRALHIRSGVTVWDETFDFDTGRVIFSFGVSKSRIVLATPDGIFGLDARSGRRVWDSDSTGYCAAIAGGAVVVGGGYAEEGGPAARGFVAR